MKRAVYKVLSWTKLNKDIAFVSIQIEKSSAKKTITASSLSEEAKLLM